MSNAVQTGAAARNDGRQRSIHHANRELANTSAVRRDRFEKRMLVLNLKGDLLYYVTSELRRVCLTYRPPPDLSAASSKQRDERGAGRARTC